MFAFFKINLIFLSLNIFIQYIATSLPHVETIYIPEAIVDPTIYWACEYLSMLGLKLNHVSKGVPKETKNMNLG